MPDKFTPTDDWLYRHILASAHIAVIYCDSTDIVRLWNQGAEQVFGWTAEEVLGESMDLIIPEKHRAAHWNGYKRVMISGATQYSDKVLAVPARTKNGRHISIEFNVVLLKAPAGEVVGAAAILRDVTERWQRDKELRQRLAAEAKAEASFDH